MTCILLCKDDYRYNTTDYYKMSTRQKYIAQADLQKLERMYNWLHHCFPIPKTSKRFGFSSVFTLIPFGSTITLCMNGYLIKKCSEHDLPSRLTHKILRHCIVSWLLGLPPIVGVLFVALYRADAKNMKLVIEHFPSIVTRPSAFSIA